MEPVIVVHGGAAKIVEDRICGKMCGVKAAVQEGYRILTAGGSAVDAVEACIVIMENNEYFNAGFGSVLNLDGQVEMDASIMDGSDLSAGAVALVHDVQNPISLARMVRERSPHILLAGTGASQFARSQGMKIVPPDSLVSEYSRDILAAFICQGGRAEDREVGGTVGAVAIDRKGNVAAGTSTGGTNGKLKGRIGDTPQIGSGTYADNRTGAVSCTGNGEANLKTCLAFSIVKEIELGKSANAATTKGIQNLMDRVNSTAGAITISKTGDIGLHFSTSMMPWAYKKNGQIHFGLEPGQDLTESS